MNQTERLRQVDGLYRGVPYAYASTVPADASTVFLAGSCPLDQDGDVVGVGSYEAQAVACLETMKLALSATGAGLGDVVFLRALVASSARADLSSVWAVIHAAFGEDAPPGTLVGVTVLGWPDQLVEIEAVAALSD